MEEEQETCAEKHNRLCRALEASLEKEEGLLTICRRLKNLVVEKSSQLLIAQRQKALDDATIGDLRANAEKATLEATRLRKKEEATLSAIEALRRQVDDLENKLRSRDKALETLHQQLDKNQSKERPMQHFKPIEARVRIPSKTQENTPFQAWKISSRHITPNTPAASDNFIPPGQPEDKLLASLKDAPRDPYGLTFNRRL